MHAFIDPDDFGIDFHYSVSGLVVQPGKAQQYECDQIDQRQPQQGMTTAPEQKTE